MPHLLELHPGRHLLGDQRGLDAVEQALQPADQLGLGDPQLGVGRGLSLAERQGDPLELVDQLGGQALLQLGDRARGGSHQPGPAGLVERRAAHLLEQLLDHAADPHHLGRLLDQLDRVALVLLGLRRRWADGVVPLGVTTTPRSAALLLLAHPAILPDRTRLLAAGPRRQAVPVAASATRPPPPLPAGLPVRLGGAADRAGRRPALFGWWLGVRQAVLGYPDIALGDILGDRAQDSHASSVVGGDRVVAWG